MGTLTKMLKYVAGQVVISTVTTAARRVGSEAGDEIGKVAAKKSVEQLRKHVLKEEEEPQAPKPVIKTGNAKLDALASILMEQAKNNIGTTNTPATTNDIEAYANHTEDISYTAEIVASTIAGKTQKTVNTAKQIGQAFIKGLKKG